METQKIGDWGEGIVCRYLMEKGYQILSRNEKKSDRGKLVGEIDITARAGDTLIFVEVKTRKSSGFGRPAEFVNAGKREKLRKTALLIDPEERYFWRFDVAEVFYGVLAGKPYVNRLNYIESAF